MIHHNPHPIPNGPRSQAGGASPAAQRSRAGSNRPAADPHVRVLRAGDPRAPSLAMAPRQAPPPAPALSSRTCKPLSEEALRVRIERTAQAIRGDTQALRDGKAQAPNDPLYRSAIDQLQDGSADDNTFYARALTATTTLAGPDGTGRMPVHLIRTAVQAHQQAKLTPERLQLFLSASAMAMGGAEMEPKRVEAFVRTLSQLSTGDNKQYLLLLRPLAVTVGASQLASAFDAQGGSKRLDGELQTLLKEADQPLPMKPAERAPGSDAGSAALKRADIILDRAVNPLVHEKTAKADMGSLAKSPGQAAREHRRVLSTLVNAHANGAIGKERLRALLTSYMQALPTAFARNEWRGVLDGALGGLGDKGLKRIHPALKVVQSVLNAAGPPPLPDRLELELRSLARSNRLVQIIEQDGNVQGEQRWHDLTSAMVETLLEWPDGSTGVRLKSMLDSLMRVSPGPRTDPSDLLATALQVLADNFGPALASKDANARALAVEQCQQAIEGCVEGSRAVKSTLDPNNKAEGWAANPEADIRPDDFDSIFANVPTDTRLACSAALFRPNPATGEGTTPVHRTPVMWPQPADNAGARA